MKKLMAIGLITIFFAFLITACSEGEESEIDTASVPTEEAETEPGDSKQEATTQGVVPDASEDADEGPEEEEVTRSFAGKVPAPEFPEGLDWLNSDGPLSLADLRGKIVLLDFWTYGCINCMHIIPDLKMLEEKYADELVVIGVHSAKFSNEGETDNIRNIILRYDLEHPVVNDRDFRVWAQYGASAWPTLILIDPEGKVLGYHSGEGIYEPFDTIIGGMVEEFDTLGLIDRTPLNLKLEQEGHVDSPLRFPGKVLADSANNRLFIADSNHNRIVISDLEGNVLDVIGDSRERLADGDYRSSSFFRPQGMALADDETLYVADTENHAIRRIDLDSRQVTTIAGTGEQVYMRVPQGQADEMPLNSPWDVLYFDDLLYIAMAGQHQVWVYNPENGQISLFAGSGREELRDGHRLQGGLNQPSGLATDGQRLFIADSEASAVRTAEFGEDGQLGTIVGTGLFDFGDIDGSGSEVRLQHPLGVVYSDGLLYVADTYNSKIKIIDPETTDTNTFLGSTEAGWRDGIEPLFNEPGGLSIDDGVLYVADTNNHVVRVVDLASGEASTLVLIDMEGLLTQEPPDSEYSGSSVSLPEQSVHPGAGAITLDIVVPDGYKINDLAPFLMEWVPSNDTIQIQEDTATQQITDPSFPLQIPVEYSAGQGELVGDLVVYYCDEEAESLCLIERLRVNLPVSVSTDAVEDTLIIKHEIPEPENFQGTAALGG